MSRTAQFTNLTSTVTNATTSFTDVTGLTLNVTAGLRHRFRACIPYSCNAITTGSAWSVAGTGTTAATLLSYVARWTGTTATTESVSYQSAADTGTSSTDAPATSGLFAIIEGSITPSATGLLTIRFKSEVAVAGGVVAQPGGWLEVREMP